jgi:hypothetical protein
LQSTGSRFAFFPKLVAPAVAAKAVRLLDERMRPLLATMRTPIPPTSITGMTRNYSEQLGKTVRVKTASLNGKRTKAERAGREIGLRAMLQSASMHQFAERLSGHRLEPACGCQVICYEEGDYTGPHNDHHPEDAHLRDGYVDVQIMLANSAVGSQLLVYERDGYLSQAVNIAQSGAVAVYRLPFWHYTTPLLAREGNNMPARRWLLLASFTFAQASQL